MSKPKWRKAHPTEDKKETIGATHSKERDGSNRFSGNSLVVGKLDRDRFDTDRPSPKAKLTGRPYGAADLERRRKREKEDKKKKTLE